MELSDSKYWANEALSKSGSLASIRTCVQSLEHIFLKARPGDIHS